jgi:acyl CoA:acetate/3-ketoacid CoA transferase beta subunit
VSQLTSDQTGRPQATRAEICVVACADTWIGAGEVLASPIGIVPAVGARLARLTSAPNLVMSDGEALLIMDVPKLGATGPDVGVIEGWLPYRRVFDIVAAGRRQVMMGASQIDRYGNQNISAIGDWRHPAFQLIGVRGAPGNTVNHRTDYWVPRHSRRVFVERVDVVSGVGHDRARANGAAAARYHDVRVVVTDLAVLDFATPDRSMRLRSVHPGVTVEQVQLATGFPLVIEDVTETRLPNADELHLIRDVIDPAGLRNRELPS